MSDMTAFFHEVTEVAAHCGEYEDDFLLKAEIRDRITIYARIHACSEVLVYAPNLVYHATDNFVGKVKVLSFSPEGDWQQAVDEAYAELFARKPIR